MTLVYLRPESVASERSRNAAIDFWYLRLEASACDRKEPIVLAALDRS